MGANGVYNGTMEAQEQGQVRVGPAGWSYEDWKGIVYPSGMPKSRHPLTLLCDWFDTVEVNSTFYRPPDPSHCASWVQQVAANPRFKFTVKLWQRFTHERDAWPTDDEIARFRSGLEPLHESRMLGAVLIQFPWSFRRNDVNRRWLGRIVETFADYPLALEVRHASWDRPEVYRGLTEHGVAFCNIDQPLFHDSLAPTEVVTAPVGYVRLHGRNHDDWFRKEASRDDRYNYLYSDEELRPWIQKVEALRKKASEIYAITNNHYRGQAVVNAFEIQAGLGMPVPSLPNELRDTYPRLNRLETTPHPPP